MNKVTKWLLRGFLGTAAIFGGYLGGIQLFGNFAEVVPGELYRAAQPSPSDLKRYARDYGIKTVLNLRGGRPGEESYEAGAKAAEDAGATYLTYHMSSDNKWSRKQVADLLAIFETAEKPILVHCKSGSDRTGLASAIYLGVYKQQDDDLAESQISIRYGHVAAFGLSKSFAMDETWENIETWYEIADSDD